MKMRQAICGKNYFGNVSWYLHLNFSKGNFDTLSHMPTRNGRFTQLMKKSHVFSACACVGSTLSVLITQVIYHCRAAVNTWMANRCHNTPRGESMRRAKWQIHGVCRRHRRDIRFKKNITSDHKHLHSRTYMYMRTRERVYGWGSSETNLIH